MGSCGCIERWGDRVNDGSTFNISVNSDQNLNINASSQDLPVNVDMHSENPTFDITFNSCDEQIPVQLSAQSNIMHFSIDGSDNCKVLYGTSAYWNSQPTLMSKRGYIYIYSDWKEIDDQYIAGFKAGDGTSFLIDLPFDNDCSKIFYKTRNEWNADPTLKTKSGYIYIYSDAYRINDNVYPSFKIGDGNSFLIDMPFFDEKMLEHINNHVIHITQEEREFWNNKVRSYISESDAENIIFTIN